MTLVQNEGRDAEIDRVMRGIITHCNARVDGIPPSEHAARAALAGRLLDAAGGDESLINFSDPAFVAELLKLSLNKSLT
jgi:hypothetical protein